LMIDQNKLPHSFEITACGTAAQTAKAIKDMTVRGAPAIGAAAGFAMAQAISENPKTSAAARATIESTRPTAVDLFYSTKRVFDAAAQATDGAKTAWSEANAIAGESVAACKAIGETGLDEVFGKRKKMRIMTHCNAGWLACVDWGTALAPIYAAKASGLEPFVYCTETRPRGQGARLTAFELSNEGVDHAIIADGAAAWLMKKGEIDAVIVGADRIAANGDTANKIGTFGHAIAAKEHGLPFFVAAPTSTIDPGLENGESIPIEERDENEVHLVRGVDEAGVVRTVRWTNPASHARNPAFDVTPARLITQIITEKGISTPSRIKELVE
jgi:S-methyl-5-thioribose-1-phosphate isomerase